MNNIPGPDYGTGLTNIMRQPLSAQEMPYFHNLVMALNANMFELPWGRANGNIILEEGQQTSGSWTVAYGRFHTYQQNKWFVVLLYSYPGNAGHRVVGRIYFENFNLPHSGTYLRNTFVYSIDRTGTTIEITRTVEITDRPDEGLF